MLFWGCQTPPNNDKTKLLSFADCIMEQSSDSALSILQSIGDTANFNEAQRAYYLLLLTQAEYKCDTVQTVDTLLDYSIAHYRKVDDESLLARSLYYRGMTQFYRGKPDVALTYLMEGVDIAEKIGDMLQLSKYYESLFQVNYEAKYFEKSLDYAKLFLDNSIERKDTDCIVRGYSHVSSNMRRLSFEDSVLIYLQKSLPLVPFASIATQTATLTNIGVKYNKMQKYDSAKIYLQKSLAIKPRNNTNKVLGDIYYKEGDIKLASEYWEKALDTDNIRLKISTLKSIHKHVLKSENYERAHTLLNNIKYLEDSLKQSQKTNEIAELQYKYEASKKEKEYYYEKSRHYMIMLVLLLITFSVSLLLYIYRRKIKSHIENIKQQHKKIEKDLGKQLEKTNNKIIRQENTIKELNKEKIKAIKEKEVKIHKHNENLQIGYGIFEKIRSGEPIPANVQRAEICLVEYFQTIYPEKYDMWEKEHGPLTKRQTIYLILKDMEFDNNQIKDILQCSDSAFRTLKSRFNVKNNN